MRRTSSAPACRPDGALRRGQRALLAALACGALGCAGHAHAAAGTADRDPALRAAVQAAIGESPCFADHFDAAVWYKLMEPKLRRYLPDRDERLSVLGTLWCEARRDPVTRLPPGLVLAVIEVESGFNRWAVSNAGAVGLMQIMPFWPEQLGMRRKELIEIEANIRMGCAILRFYLQRERADFNRALARYNGSVGSRTYSGKVIGRWTRMWNGADDLALNAATAATPRG